jgi:hypothetical protein
VKSSGWFNTFDDREQKHCFYLQPLLPLSTPSPRSRLHFLATGNIFLLAAGFPLQSGLFRRLFFLFTFKKKNKMPKTQIRAPAFFNIAVERNLHFNKIRFVTSYLKRS